MPTRDFAACARTFCRRPFYDRLLESPDITSAVKELMSTEYGPDLESEIVRGRTAAVIDDALKINMVRSYQKVFSFLHPSARALLSTLLGRWDVFNIKTILRGAHNKVPIDEVKESFFPAGYMSELGARSAREVRRRRRDHRHDGRLGSGVRGTAAQGVSRSTRRTTTSRRSSWRWTSSTRSGQRRGSSADRKTPRSRAGFSACRSTPPTWSWCSGCSRPTSEHAKAEKYFLEGGRAIRKELFLQIAGMSDVDEVLDRLKRTAYSERARRGGSPVPGDQLDHRVRACA